MTGNSTPADATTNQKPVWPLLWHQFIARILNPVNLVLCTAGAAITALIGPFDTYAADSFAFRLVFWSGVVFSATLLANFIGVWADLRFSTRPYWYRSAIGATIFTSLYFILIWSAINAIYPTSVLPHPLIILLLISAITVVVYAVMWVFKMSLEQRLEEQMISPKPKVPEPEPQAQPKADLGDDRCPFLKRLGPDGGTTLIRLAMSDHYIEAHTDTGMHLLYLRFADAIAELKPQNGTQVHRSHWVNFSQIEDVIRNGQKIMFRMSDGATVPVSRSRKKALQEIGIL